MKTHRHNRGFTLLEVLIAMSIFSIIGLASTAMLSTVIDSDELSTERFDKLQQLQRTMLTLERDLLQAIPRATRVEGESNTQVMIGRANQFESDTDGLAFVRAGWSNPQMMLPRSTLQAVGYRLQNGELQRLYGNYVDNVIGYEPKVRVLLKDVEDFQVEFLLQPNNDPGKASAWQETFASDSLPLGVAVTILSKDFGEVRREFVLASGGPGAGTGSGAGS